VSPARRKLKGDRLSSYQAAGITKITIVAAKRPGLTISTVAQQAVVVNMAARTARPAAAAAAPAAYVRAVGLAVERLEQTYVRTTDESTGQRYDYTAPAFDFGARLVYDQSGLVLDYPGIAVRAG
jgi:Putative glycolipid-binding